MKGERGRPPPQTPNDSDIRPAVGRAGGSASVWLFSGVAVLVAILLFSFLDNRRRELSAPSTTARLVDQVGTVSALPPLVFPYVPAPPPIPSPTPLATVAFPPTAAAERVFVGPQPAPQAQYVPRPPSPPPAPPAYSSSQDIAPPVPPGAQRPPLTSSSSVLVIDAAADPSTQEVGNRPPGPANLSAATSREVARSGVLRRQASTVPQGTLIPAVLETALDSSRPGFARAIVSRDVTGFDGGRVLIPRGSRLFGEYQTELAAGQNRATVQWTRLVRPDGVIISLDSPAADPGGRAGVEGRVNNRYLERFAGALLQTTMNVGASLAGRGLGNGAVIVALPGSTQGGVSASADSSIRPTLRVEAGTRVSVLVARDLEFTSGERRR